MEVEKEIEAKLEKLKELSPFHEDIAFLYKRFKEEYERLKELPIDRATLERSLSSLKKRMDSMMEVVERYKARYEFFERVKKELEKSGVNHLVFVFPKKERVSVKIAKPEEIFPFSRIAHARALEFRDITEAISGIANLKLGKIAVCEPVGYLRYKCVVDGKELILDYG